MAVPGQTKMAFHHLGLSKCKCAAVCGVGYCGNWISYQGGNMLLVVICRRFVYLTHPIFALLPIWEFNHEDEISSQTFLGFEEKNEHQLKVTSSCNYPENRRNG